MYLVDTNVWLERLLDQELAAEVKAFLDAVPSGEMVITEFALYSIGLSLTRTKRTGLFLEFVNDTFIEGEVTLLRLHVEDMGRLTGVLHEFNLDFDDAYQYVAAEKHGLTLVSFDAHFDRTPRGRQTPAQVLKARAEQDK
ncbi:MAG: type II toxin-antitoxin system VapC family toxin [Anaerolineae bacterium]|nr:type II toxin-antitoxin system VapC family toxin [Anaerolineae bacterium]